MTDPTAPFETGYYDTPGFSQGVAVCGNLAYVADKFCFEIFDCSQALPVKARIPSQIPGELKLLPPSPNPFNNITIINFDLPVAGPVYLYIYNSIGQQVYSLATRISQPGTNQIIWDAEGLGSGVYFIRLTIYGRQSEVQKVILQK
jgi:hypothetical protein